MNSSALPKGQHIGDSISQEIEAASPAPNKRTFLLILLRVAVYVEGKRGFRGIVLNSNERDAVDKIRKHITSPHSDIWLR